MQKLSIASWGGDKSGVLQYRWVQPLQELYKRGHDIIKLPNIMDKSAPDYAENLAYCAHVIPQCDVLFMNNPGYVHTLQMIKALKKANPKLKIVADYDDDQFNISPHNSVFRFAGRKEYKAFINNEWQWVWKRGKDFDPDKNRNELKATVALMGMCDLVFVTTERLKFKFRRYIPKERMVIAPNGIDFELFDMYEGKSPSDTVRIGWTLSFSHMPDWMEIRKSLGNVLKRNKNTVLVTIGNYFGGGRDIPLSQREHIGWENEYYKYLHKLFTAGIDIGICPLSNNTFNWKKSPLKWEELSALKIPCVVSSVLYKDYVKDGETGLVYDTPEDFEDKLQKLIDNEYLRKSIGEAAYDKVREDYNILKIANIYESSLEKLVNPIKIYSGGLK